MPTYELSLVLRQMSRPEVVSALKRTAEAIFEKGGIIRKLENLGTRALPHKLSEHGLVHREGSYFAIEFDTAPTKIADLKEEFGRDIDIIRRQIFKLEEPQQIECTLHEELLPPAYRKDVQKMMDIAKRSQKKRYNYNSGLDYYPFQNFRMQRYNNGGYKSLTENDPKHFVRKAQEWLLHNVPKQLVQSKLMLAEFCRT